MSCNTITNDHKLDTKPATIGSSRPLNRVGSAYAVGAEPTTVAERMVRRRLEMKLTQAEVAAKVRMQNKSGPRSSDERLLSRNGYCMYENGRSEPKLEQIKQIAMALNVSAGWLAFGETPDEAQTLGSSIGDTFPISISVTVLPVGPGVTHSTLERRAAMNCSAAR